MELTTISLRYLILSPQNLDVKTVSEHCPVKLKYSASITQSKFCTPLLSLFICTLLVSVKDMTYKLSSMEFCKYRALVSLLYVCLSIIILQNMIPFCYMKGTRLVPYNWIT